MSRQRAGNVHVPGVEDDGDVLVGAVELLVSVGVHDHAQP